MTATSARNNFSEMLYKSKNDTVTISKKNKDIAVVISSERYKELKKLEDYLY